MEGICEAVSKDELMTNRATHTIIRIVGRTYMKRRKISARNEKLHLEAADVHAALEYARRSW